MGRLSLVPTPIGNLGDITQRALAVLRDADVVAAEDTRRSRLLLEHYRITTPLERLDANVMEARAALLWQRYQYVAYVTDAGTPGISDPGAELVRRALTIGVEVEVLPGATALVPALVLSGLPTNRFTFEGFLPRKGSERRRRIERIALSTCTSVIYEAPLRLAATLKDLSEACGPDRRVSISRELSKRFETTVRGRLGELAARFGTERVRGELVLVVAPACPPGRDDLDEHSRTAAALAGVGVRGAQLRAALEALGVPRNEAYAAALRFRDDAAS